MRLAAPIRGLRGGVLGFLAAVFGSGVARIGAVLAISKPRAAWILLTIAAAWLMVSTPAFGRPGGFMMLVAAAMAFVASMARVSPTLTALRGGNE